MATAGLHLNYPEPELTDGVVVLRRWRMDDLPCIEEASSDPRIPQGTTVPAVYTEAEGRAFIERNWGRQTKGTGLSMAIADTTDDRARGLAVVMARRTRGTAEIGYWLVPSARNQGRGNRAVRLLSHWAVRQQEIDRLQAHVEPWNAPSIRVLEAAGFQREGLLRSVLAFDDRRADALLYSLLPSDLPPTEIA